MSKRGSILIFFFFTLSFMPVVLFAQTTTPSGLTEYKLLEPLPFDSNGLTTKTAAPGYIQGLFRLTIALAAVLAVLRLIYAGIIKASSDAISNQNKAKDIISEAIWGLLLALGAWIIVATILPTKNGQFVFDLSLPTSPIPENTNLPAGDACSNCVTFDSLKLPTRGSAVGKSIAPYFGDKLVLLNKSLAYNKIDWYLTEGYPPSVGHDSGCHGIGTCVDANVSNPSVANINKFVTSAAGTGLLASYEVLTVDAKNTLVKAGVNPAFILVNPKATAPHFHVIG